MLQRKLKDKFESALKRGKSILLLGPRQTGKTTFISQFSADMSICLLLAKTRRGYESDPDRLVREVESLKKGRVPLIVIDEVQKVPQLMDVIQYLIDEKLGQFILTGSSARKLKVGSDINLLPGRVIEMRLDPLSFEELPKPSSQIEDLFTYGTLPAIYLESEPAFKDEELSSYVDLYLEDEVRAEALVRNMGPFENFLKMAAIESGNMVNFDKISQDVGVARSTIKSYYQVLEDCLIVEKIEPYTVTRTRKKLIKSSKYLFFDLGIRRLAAGEPHVLPDSYYGPLFEQYIGLEILRWTRLQRDKISLHYWKDTSGPEVDWIILCGNQVIPIEVKWTDSPTARDAKHVSLFLKEYPEAKAGFVVCQTPRPQMLGDGIEAIHWKDLIPKLTYFFNEKTGP
jgi:predicted AAA+ superfamily ATPase